MTRYIDADALIEAMTKFSNATGEDMTHGIFYAHIAPTIDAEPVRHGKWKWLSCTYDRVPKEKEYVCSECHHKTIVHGDDMPWEKYCPNCGARMDKE